MMEFIKQLREACDKSDNAHEKYKISGSRHDGFLRDGMLEEFQALANPQTMRWLLDLLDHAEKIMDASLMRTEYRNQWLNKVSQGPNPNPKTPKAKVKNPRGGQCPCGAFHSGYPECPDCGRPNSERGK